MDTRPAIAPLSAALVMMLRAGAALADPPPSASASAPTTAVTKTPPAASSAEPVSHAEESVTRRIADGKLQRTLAVVTGSVGFAGIGVGSVFGILAVSRWNDVKSSAASCRDPASYTGCPMQLRIDQRAASSYATVANYGIVTGTLFFAGAVAMWYLAPRRPKPAARLDLVPMVGPGGAGGFVLGAF